jgi:hypothetical protein
LRKKLVHDGDLSQAEPALSHLGQSGDRHRLIMQLAMT